MSRFNSIGTIKQTSTLGIRCEIWNGKDTDKQEAFVGDKIEIINYKTFGKYRFSENHVIDGVIYSIGKRYIWLQTSKKGTVAIKLDLLDGKGIITPENEKYSGYERCFRLIKNNSQELRDAYETIKRVYVGWCPTLEKDEKPL